MPRPAPGGLPRGGGGRGLGVREGGRAARAERGAGRRPWERQRGKWRLRAVGRERDPQQGREQPDPERACALPRGTGGCTAVPARLPHPRGLRARSWVTLRTSQTRRELPLSERRFAARCRYAQHRGGPNPEAYSARL